MRKKGLPEAIVGVIMSLYPGVKTKVGEASELSEELWVKVGVY